MSFQKILALRFFSDLSIPQLMVKLFSGISKIKREAIISCTLSRLVNFTLIVLIGFNWNTGSAAAVRIKDAMPHPAHEFQKGDKVNLYGPLPIAVGTGTITSLDDNSVAANGTYNVLSKGGDWSFTISHSAADATYQVAVKLTGDVSKEVNFSGSASLNGNPNDCDDSKTTITYLGNGQSLVQSCQEYKASSWWPLSVGQSESVFITPSFEIPPLGKVTFKVFH